jgi:predicted transposase YdaD
MQAGIGEPELAQVQEAEHMLTRIDAEKMPSYAIGLEDGEARGEARSEALGEARGEAKGELMGKAYIVRRLLSRLDIGEVAELLSFSR